MNGFVKSLFALGAMIGVCAIFLVLPRASRESGPSVRSPAGRMDNVVLIVVDTLRADWIAAHRNSVPLMPKLHGLAVSSWWFRNAISQGSWTKPAMATIFTSLYPSVHKVELGIPLKIVEGQTPEIDLLSDNLETMASYLGNAGYATAAVQSNMVLADKYGFEQGFDTYYYKPYPEFRADEVTQVAKDMVSGLDSPFFLYVHYMDPHCGYDPPEKYRGMFGPLPPLTKQDEALLAEYNVYYRDRIFNDIGVLTERKKPDLTESGREHVRTLYDGEVRFIDDEVSSLIEWIEARCGPSLIIITSDHGEEFWEHGSVGHGKTVYQELVHVPLILRGPGLEARYLDSPVETIDLLPTVADRLKLDARPAWQGRSLLDLARNPLDPQRPAFARTMTSLRINNKHFESVVVWPEKLVADLKADTSALYDLIEDGAETTDLTNHRMDRSKALRAALEAHWAENASHPEYGAETVTMELDPETLEQLESIGYGGDATE